VGGLFAFAGFRLHACEPRRLEAALISAAVAAPFGRFAHSGQAQRLESCPSRSSEPFPCLATEARHGSSPVGSQNPRPVSAKGAETRTGQPRQLPLQRSIVAAPECIGPSARRKRGPQDDKSVGVIRRLSLKPTGGVRSTTARGIFRVPFPRRETAI